MDFLESLFILVGRLFLSAFFFWSVFETLKKWGDTMAYIKQKKVPQAPFILPLGVVIKVLGGILVLFGVYTRLGAFLLLSVSIPSTLYFHNFWNAEGEEQKKERVLFMKDLAIIGALFFLLGTGAGGWGL